MHFCDFVSLSDNNTIQIGQQNHSWTTGVLPGKGKEGLGKEVKYIKATNIMFVRDAVG